MILSLAHAVLGGVGVCQCVAPKGASDSPTLPLAALSEFGRKVNMETAVFQPLLDAGLARLGKFKNPEPRDIEKIFGPVFDTIALSAGNDKRRAAHMLGYVTNSPVEDIDVEKLEACVAGLVYRLDDDDAQIALQAEIDGVDDRSVILAQRSRASLEKERAKCWKRNTQSGALRAMHIEDELERRDAQAEGRPYEARETTAPWYKPLPAGSR